VCDCYSYWVVQFACVFFIDIPFKGSRCLSNSRSPGTVVSYWHIDSGVISTTVLGTMVSKCCRSGSKSGFGSGWIRAVLVGSVSGRQGPDLDPDPSPNKMTSLKMYVAKCNGWRNVILANCKVAKCNDVEL
jgi:hypothetical protein